RIFRFFDGDRSSRPARPPNVKERLLPAIAVRCLGVRGPTPTSRKRQRRFVFLSVADASGSSESCPELSIKVRERVDDLGVKLNPRLPAGTDGAGPPRARAGIVGSLPRYVGDVLGARAAVHAEVVVGNPDQVVLVDAEGQQVVARPAPD